MAYFDKGLKHKIKTSPPIKLGGGLNQSLSAFEIAPSEASDSLNVSSRLFPVLTTRAKTSVYWTSGATEYSNVSAAPWALGKRSSSASESIENVLYQSGTVLYSAKGVEVMTGLAAAVGKIVEFNTETARYTVLMNGTNKKSWDGSSVADIADAPLTNLVTVDDFRLYCLKGNVLYYSAEGSITDWTTVDSAGDITVTNMIGNGTALTTYRDYVVAWSEQSMHILQGDDPFNYSLTDAFPDGCISDKSVVTLNGILYWLDNGEFKAWDGGKPRTVSQKVKTYLDGINPLYKTLCSAGVWNRFIYLSIPYGSATRNNITLIYDTEYNIWNVWGRTTSAAHKLGPTEKGVVAFVTLGENLYGFSNRHDVYTGDTVTASNYYLTRLSDYEGNVETSSTGIGPLLIYNDLYWHYTTGIINENLIAQKKTLSNIWIMFKLPANTSVTTYYDPQDDVTVAPLNRLRVSYSLTVAGDDFVTITTFNSLNVDTIQRFQLPTTMLQNVDYYRLKFSGSGPCTIYAIEYEYRVKAR